MRNIFLLLLFAVVLAVPQQAVGNGHRLVKVGVFQVEPIIFVSDDGEPRGLFVDVIEEIAAQEGWRLKYVQGTWDEGFNRMRNGEIDLMTAVAYSQERDAFLDYPNESVLTLWGQVFVREGISLQNILDLQDKPVAIMRGDINGKNFVETIKKFEISCEIHEFSSLEEVFGAVERDEVAAGVAPNVFGYVFADRHGLVGTGIIFSPVSTYFATASAGNGELLSTLDSYLHSWKKDKESFYYRRLDHWFGGEQFEEPVPAWLFISLIIVLLVALALAFWSRTLKTRVSEKTNELRQSQEDYRQLVENSNSIILRWDVNGVVTFMNEFGQQFFGYRRDEIVGKNVVGTIVAENDRSGKDMRAMIQGILTTPADYLLNENENMCRDGSRVWIQWSNKPIVDKQGLLLEILSVGFDVTKLNRIEREKRENEQRYRILFESAIDAVLILREGVFWDCNRRALEMFDCTMSQILGNSPIDFSPEEQPGGRSSQAEAKNRIAAALAGESQFFPWIHKRRDGSHFDAEVSLNRIDFGDDIYIQAIVRDVSERVQLEGELRQAQKMEAIGTLAGGIAHDFNNILTSIFGFTELAQFHQDTPDKLQRDLTEVEKAAARAKDLVEQILTFGRKSEQEKRPLHISTVIKEALKLLRSSLPATIEIQQNIRSNTLVDADPIQIHQIIMNLCTNAYHAMRSQGGTLTVSLGETDLVPGYEIAGLDLPPGHYVLLEVEDTGNGIGPEIIGKIYEPYFTTKGAGEGTGLGLSLVHGIVKGHQGGMHVRSELGSGTVFAVYLPVVDGHIDELPKKELEKTTEETCSGRIMLVDDEQDILAVGKQVLETFGYDVTTFADPSLALDAIKKESSSYDLLVTDMTMPVMTGAELAAKVLEIRRDFPIILCTGYSELINRESALALGIRDYLQKPVVMAALAQKIKSILCP
ncbi:MAG: PAS domain S-box protein [Thermodesulfobacteriota bacterium]